MKKGEAFVHQIDIRVSELSALFNSMDPTPFHRRDLDRDAAAFLEEAAFDLAYRGPLALVVHLESMPDSDPAALLAEAIANYFEDRAARSKRRLHALFREGRISLVIGLAFLALCLLGAERLAEQAATPLTTLLKEGLLIGGWVAMWRPMQIFLYEWWPLLYQRSVYRRLGRATVEVQQAAPAA